MIQHSVCKTPLIIITNVHVTITNLGFNESPSLVATMCDLTNTSGQPISSKNIKSVKIDKLYCITCSKEVSIKDATEVCACGNIHPVSELLYIGNPLFVIAKLECIKNSVVYGELDERLLKMIDSYPLEELFSDKLGAISNLFRSS